MHGNALWMMTIFVLFAIIITSTVSPDALDTKFAVEGLNEQQRTELAFTTGRTAFPLGEDEDTYRHVEVHGDSSVLRFDISNHWLRAHDEQDLRVYRLDAGTWTLVAPRKLTQYTDTTLVEVDGGKGEYVIVAGKQEGDAWQDSLRKALPYLVIIILLLLLIRLKHHRPRRSRQLLDDRARRLDEYLRKALIDGHTELQVKEKLVSAGWSAKEVDQALRRLRFF